MRGRIGKRLPTISFTRKPSLRQPEQRTMASPRPANPPAPAAPLRPGTGTQTARGVRRAADGDKKVNGRDFAGNRPFLGQGKSQKALSTQDKPLTIEQVRELLNKNK